MQNGNAKDRNGEGLKDRLLDFAARVGKMVDAIPGDRWYASLVLIIVLLVASPAAGQQIKELTNESLLRSGLACRLASIPWRLASRLSRSSALVWLLWHWLLLRLSSWPRSWSSWSSFHFLQWVCV